MELAPPFIVVAAAHPSLDDAVHRFCDDLRAEARSCGSRGTLPPPPTTALIGRIDTSVRGIALAAMLDGEIIGLARVDDASPAITEVLVAVGAPWRRRGVGTALAQAIVVRAHAAGVPRLTVRTRRPGSELRELAAALGFQLVDLGRGRLDLVRSREPAIRSA